MSDTKPTMTLITSNWHGAPCFRLIPVSLDAPYAEGIYDPTSRVLVLMSKFTKESVHLLPRLNENGDPIPTKKPRPNGKPYKEQRTTLDTFTEYYVEKKEEIIELIKKVSDNHGAFDYMKYLDAPIEVPKMEPVVAEEEAN